LNILEVPTPELLELIAEDFKTKLTKPEFTEWIKTGAHRERVPQRTDWWYLRTASILYRVYRDGPVGTERLRTYYGGRKNRGVKPEKFVKASGKIIRTCLQALEKEKLIKKAKKGRIISKEGEKYLNSISKKLSNSIKTIKQTTKEQTEIKKEKQKENTEIKQTEIKKEKQKENTEIKQTEIKKEEQKKESKEKPQEKKEKK
jgi:small subunit ribosomal protein S19e